jgi:CDGSH-type Zn-finger protein/uncharacterized Fe-S cluster protein YjdI
MADVKSKPRMYRGERISVGYDLSRCMHASECIRGGLTGVFDRERRPWVLPDGADPERVVDVVERCPSGALQYQRHDGAPTEASETNSVRPQPHSALYLRGELTLKGADGAIVVEGTRLALCRCGHSRNKPFCDFSHHDAAFDDGGALGSSKLAPEVIDTEAPLEIKASKDGPLRISGPFALRSADHADVRYGHKAAFCRCGHSANKPFCDGSHRRMGFSSD